MVFGSSFCVCKGFAFSEDMISQGGLKIRENGEGDVYVDGLKEKPVSCQDDIFT